MDNDLAFALTKFQEDQTQVMREQVETIRTEQQAKVQAIEERHGRENAQNKARLADLRRAMVDVESVKTRLEQHTNEYLSRVQHRCSAELSTCIGAAQAEEKEHTAAAARRYEETLQQAAEQKVLPAAQEPEVQTVRAMLQRGDLAGAEERLRGGARPRGAAAPAAAVALAAEPVPAPAAAPQPAPKAAGGGAPADSLAPELAQLAATLAGATWAWANDRGGITAYSSEVCLSLEAAHAALGSPAARGDDGSQTVDVGGGRHVDLRKMVQVVTATPSRRRRVQRTTAEASVGVSAQISTTQITQAVMRAAQIPDDDKQAAIRALFRHFGKLARGAAVSRGSPPGGGGADDAGAAAEGAAAEGPAPAAAAAGAVPEDTPEDSQVVRFGRVIADAESAARGLREQAAAAEKAATEWACSMKGLRGAGAVLGELPFEANMARAEMAEVAADQIAAAALSMEERFAARAADLARRSEQLLQSLVQQRLVGGASPPPPAGDAMIMPGDDGAGGNAVAMEPEPEAAAAAAAAAPPTPSPPADIDKLVAQWCDETDRAQQRYDEQEREEAAEESQRQLTQVAESSYSSGRMVSAAVQELTRTTSDEARRAMGDAAMAALRDATQQAEAETERAVAALRRELGQHSYTDVAYLDPDAGQPIPMTFTIDAPFEDWTAECGTTLCGQVAEQLGVPVANIVLKNVRAGSQIVLLDVGVPAGGDRDAVIQKAATVQWSQAADENIRHVLVGTYDLKLPPGSMDARFNKEYGKGKTYWSGSNPPDGKDRGKAGWKKDGQPCVELPYYCPVGWKRYGIKVCEAAEFDRRYDGWAVAYHGTKRAFAAMILNTALKGKTGCFADGEPVVYATPSIRYASAPPYAKGWTNPDGEYVQIVFQLRVNPAHIWKVEKETLPTLTQGKQIDPNIDNSRMEWLIRPKGKDQKFIAPNQLICYGIMLRKLDQEPAWP